MNFRITPFIPLSNDASPKHPPVVISRSVIKAAHFRSSPGGIKLSKLHLECNKPHYEEPKKNKIKPARRTDGQMDQQTQSGLTDREMEE